MRRLYAAEDSLLYTRCHFVEWTTSDTSIRHVTIQNLDSKDVHGMRHQRCCCWISFLYAAKSKSQSHSQSTSDLYISAPFVVLQPIRMFFHRRVSCWNHLLWAITSQSGASRRDHIMRKRYFKSYFVYIALLWVCVGRITSSTVALHCCKADAKINRKMGNSTPCKIVTPENHPETLLTWLCLGGYLPCSYF